MLCWPDFLKGVLKNPSFKSCLVKYVWSLNLNNISSVFIIEYLKTPIFLFSWIRLVFNLISTFGFLTGRALLHRVYSDGAGHPFSIASRTFFPTLFSSAWGMRVAFCTILSSSFASIGHSYPDFNPPCFSLKNSFSNSFTSLFWFPLHTLYLLLCFTLSIFFYVSHSLSSLRPNAIPTAFSSF